MAGPSRKVMKCEKEIIDYLDYASSDSESPLTECDVESESDIESVPERPEISVSEGGSTVVGDGWKAVGESDYPHPLHLFQEIVGPKNVPPADSPPIAYFNLFFNESLLDLFVTETNRCAQQRLSTSLLQKWKDVTVIEMKAFLACILNMGLNKKCALSSYWSTEPSQSVPWFRDMFSRHRFILILRYFSLVDYRKCPNDTDAESDPSLKYQPLVDHANSVFRHYYTPHVQISVDESPVGTKKRATLMKHFQDKRGVIKLWMLCDAVSSYCLAFYTDRDAKSEQDISEMQELVVGYVVVKLLEMGNYLRKGYRVLVDNALMSNPLVQYLHSVGTHITGTVRKKRKFVGGIDMMLCTNMDERKSVQYWKMVAFNIISQMVLNSYIIYKENSKGSGKFLSRLNFIISIIEHIGREWVSTRKISDEVGIIKLDGRREANCCVCSTKNKRKRSRTVCIRCNKGLHGECLAKHKCAF